MRKLSLILMLVLLAGCGGLVMLGNVDAKTDLSAVLEVWGDLLRDADEVTLTATRVSAEREMAFGQEVSRHLPAGDAAESAYAADVAALLTPHVRREKIRYQFHVVPGSEINAFALPGGQIYVFSGLLQFLQSEAELAAVLGHEIAHVDQRHAIARYQYELASRRVGLEGAGKLADLARLPLTIGYQKNEEIEADAEGFRLAVEAGYDPDAGPALFRRMRAAMDPAPAAHTQTPQEELARTMAGGLTGYFRSHPTSEERVRRLDELIQSNGSRLAGKSFYAGKSNLQNRIAWSKQAYPGEKRSH
jgi:predicted Zn-dependent protease